MSGIDLVATPCAKEIDCSYRIGPFAVTSSHTCRFLKVQRGFTDTVGGMVAHGRGPCTRARADACRRARVDPGGFKHACVHSGTRGTRAARACMLFACSVSRRAMEHGARDEYQRHRQDGRAAGARGVQWVQRCMVLCTESCQDARGRAWPCVATRRLHVTCEAEHGSSKRRQAKRAEPSAPLAQNVCIGHPCTAWTRVHARRRHPGRAQPAP